MDFESLYMLLRRSHIFVGFLGVAAFWVPVLAKKGGRLHVIGGRTFEWCVYYAVATSLIACGRYLLTPHHFAFIDRPGISAAELGEIQYAQFFLTMLAFLAWIVLTEMRRGVRAVRLRSKTAEEYRSAEGRFWLYSLPFAAVALIGFGVYRLVHGASSIHWLSIIVPVMTLAEMPKKRRFFLNPRSSKMSWWYTHMECMLGCGIAFHTAGFVFTTQWLAKNRGIELPGIWKLVPWVIPALIGTPATHLWIRQYKKKFGDLRSSSESKPVPTAG